MQESKLKKNSKSPKKSEQNPELRHRNTKNSEGEHLDAATSTQEEDNKKQQSIPNDYKV
jgi:hypothetical protein